MSELYKSTYRGYLIDHHSPAPPVVTLEGLDPAEYERFFGEANISNLMLYTKDHWGYSYYDTNIGTRHPALKSDWIAEISAILRQKRIEFNAYYCLEYDTLAPKQHPEWAIRDREGKPVVLKGRIAKWGMPCYETGYRKYVLGQLAEVVTNYRPDSLFLDIFGKSLCYCDCCRKLFRERYGYDLPFDTQSAENELAAFDFGEKGHDVNAFLEDSAARMLEDVIRTVKGIDPDIKVTINFAALYPKRIRDMLDYQFTEPWAGNWLSAAYSRDTAKGQYPQLGPGDVSEIYNYRPDSIYKLAAAEIAAQGCRVFLYSGSQHVDGSLEHTEAHKIGAAFREVERFERYLSDREVIADVAILQSDSSTAAKAGTHVVVNAIGRCKRSDVHREAILGAMKLCDRSGYTWKIVPEQELTRDEAKCFKVIILAGMYHITSSLYEVLKNYLREGGRIIADSECGLYNEDGSKLSDFLVSELLGVKFISTNDRFAAAEWGGYIARREDEIWRYLPDTLPPMERINYLVKPDKARVLGDIVDPCVELTDTTWVNWWCPPPASSASEYPAITEHFYGDGQAVYAAFDLFRSVNNGLNLHYELFRGILEKLVPKPRVLLVSEHPETVGIAAYTRGDSIILHHISHLAEQTGGACPEIDGGYLLVDRQSFPVTDAKCVYPVECALTVEEQDGIYKVMLPKVGIHNVAQIYIDFPTHRQR